MARIPNRVQIIQDCLEKDVLPRLLFDMPQPRSERQRAALRVVTNYICALIEGNRRHLDELVNGGKGVKHG